MSEGCEIHKCSLWQSTEILLGSFNNILKQQLSDFLEQKFAKSCAAGYVVRTIVQVHVSNTDSLKLIYYTLILL